MIEIQRPVIYLFLPYPQVVHRLTSESIGWYEYQNFNKRPVDHILPLISSLPINKPSTLILNVFFLQVLFNLISLLNHPLLVRLKISDFQEFCGSWPSDSRETTMPSDYFALNGMTLLSSPELKAQASFSNHLLFVCLSTFNIFIFHWANFNQTWHKASNEEPQLFPRGDYSEILKSSFPEPLGQ